MLRTTLRATLALSGVLALAGLAATGSTQASALPNLTLSVTKTSITPGGATQSGGVNVVTTATGVKEASAILFALKPGITLAEFETALHSGGAGDPNKVDKYGSIVFDTQVEPGHASEAQVNLTAGQYVALSAPGNGPPKVMTPFTVTAAAAPATLPIPQATISSIEFGFRGPSTIHDGELVRFENEGFLVHMDVAFPVKSKSAAKKAVKDLLKGNEKALEKLAAGPPVAFAGPISHEAFQQETITAKPGWYVQACFMETQDKRDHTLLGMERIIKITK